LGEPARDDGGAAARAGGVILQPAGLAEYTITAARRFATGQSLETLGNNDGPEIREWLGRRGIHTPASWCAAFACAMIEDAATALKDTLQMRRSAGALRLLELNHDLVLTAPETGCLVVWDHGGGLGHVGIVTGVTLVGGELASIDVISGNTNAEGSRDANQVCERGFPYPQARRLAGYVRVA
jgi:hypothetical protein